MVALSEEKAVKKNFRTGSDNKEISCVLLNGFKSTHKLA